PVKAQGNVSTDGVFIRMRGEGWKEVQITAISQVRVSRRRAKQVRAPHPAHEPYVEGLRRGADCARVTSVNDGAAWIERMTRADFPAAIQIVDLRNMCIMRPSGPGLKGQMRPRLGRRRNGMRDGLEGHRRLRRRCSS
ncbi:MAG: hypothetical protein ACK4WM_01610, partial [Thermoflexales bacterium]